MTKAILRRLLVFVLMGAATTAMAEDLTFTGGAGTGSLTDKDNWGGTLPGADDQAIVPYLEGFGSFFLGADFTVSSSKWTGWSASTPAVLDLKEKTMNLGTFTLGASSTLVLTNGTFNLTSGKTSFGASSVLYVNKDAVVTFPDTLASGTFTIGKTAKIVVDGGYLCAPMTSGSSYGTGVTFGEYNNGSHLTVINGGTFTFPSTKGRKTMLLYGGSKMTVKDSTFDIGNGNNVTFPMMSGNGGVRVSASNSTFNVYSWNVGGNAQIGVTANKGIYDFVDSTYTSGFTHDPYNYGFRFYKSTSDTLNITRTTFSSSIYTDGTVSGLTVNFNGGTLEGDVLFANNPSSSKYIQRGGKLNGRVQITGKNNEFRVLGGKGGKEHCNYKFDVSGSGHELEFSGGATYWSSQWAENAAVFSIAKGAKDVHTVVSNATWYWEGYVYLTASNDNCVVEFRGATPRIELRTWQKMDNTYQVQFGSSDSELLGHVTALKFVLPSAPYATAPIYGYGNLKPIKFHPNAKIIVEEGDWTIGTDRTKTFYPLAYDAKSFNSEMTAELVASLNANATLPEGAALEYDSAKKVLGVRMPRKKLGMMLIVQ